MSYEELGYEVTPKQSLDGLWKTIHKYIEHHGYSDISLEIEGSQYEFRQHLQKYDEYEAKAKAFDEIRKARKEILVDVHERGFNLPADQDNFTLRTENIINKYESGESND